MRNSLYWDNFSQRIDETVHAIRNNTLPTIGMVAVFITDKCNMRCSYCNNVKCGNEMKEDTFDKIVKDHPNAIIHITGGEPSCVKWLYPYLKTNSGTFHLNTNALMKPPSESVKRLKVSLDSCNSNYWDSLVGVNGAFDKVVKNIIDACSKTTVSITYTLTHENFRNVIEFSEFVKREFNGLYATFFSVYKGNNVRFALTDEDVSEFFGKYKEKLLSSLDEESRFLFIESIDEKFRLMQTTRFPENCLTDVCYISLSERVYRWDGSSCACSHLFRDGILNKPGEKHEKCSYGCNRRLILFNEEVSSRL
jgi:MoaA/NifB/PqqE/SkfB family radical SAM enzyme